MRANALKHWCHDKMEATKVYHPLESSFWGYRFGCSLYNYIQKKLPILHFGYFYFLEFAAIHRKGEKIIGSRKFIDEVDRFKPSAVISMHSHLNHGYFHLLRKAVDSKLPFSVYAGELDDGIGFSRHWINPDINLFAGPTKECCLAAVKRGMPVPKCLAAGPLLRKAFHANKPKNRESVLRKYSLSPNCPTYLLSTGANGVNNHKQVANAFIRSGLECQLIALCGKNNELVKNLNALDDRNHKIRIIPLKTVSDEVMRDLLESVDFVFARPGAGICTEVLVSKCRIIFDLSGGIMPQEINNLNYWKRHASKVITCSNPSDLPKLALQVSDLPILSLPISERPSLLLDSVTKLSR